jgi:hypothetical protein
MSRKNDLKKIGYQELSWYSIVGWEMILTFLVFYIDTFPYRSDWYLLVSIPTGVFCFLNLIWLYRKPNLYAKFFFHVSLSVMFALVSCRCFSELFPQFSFIIHALTLITVLYVHTLHIWDAPTVTFIRNELWAPRTWVGKLLFKATLAFASIGLFLALTLSHYGKSTAYSLFVGTLGLLASIMFAFSKAPSSPWESSLPIDNQQDNQEQETEEELLLPAKTPSRRISSKKKK